MKVGVTGSRHARPDEICLKFRELLIAWAATEVHHGDCLGWDKQAHEIAADLGLRTVAHPPSNPSLRAYCDATEVRDPLPYLDRNKQIVLSCDKLVAAPEGPEKTRSGTWSTVRFAKNVGTRGVILWS
jgi:hypothetical protein